MKFTLCSLMALLGVLCLMSTTGTSGSGTRLLSHEVASSTYGSRTYQYGTACTDTGPYFECKAVTSDFCNNDNEMTPCNAACAACSGCSNQQGVITLRRCCGTTTEVECTFDYSGLVFCGTKTDGECTPSTGCKAGWTSCSLNGATQGACSNVSNQC